MAFRLQPLWYQICRWSCRLGLTLGFSLQSEGNQYIPATGPYLILANHQSYLDPPAIGGCVGRNLYFLARHTLWKGWFGNLLTSVNCIPVNQEGVATAALRSMMEILQRGEGTVIFPEGTRSYDGTMTPLQPGVLLLIKRLPDFPIIPVGVSGFYQAWPQQAKWPTFSPLFLPARERGTVAVSFGKPISSGVYRDVDRDVILADLFQRIDAQRLRAEFIRRKATD